MIWNWEAIICVHLLSLIAIAFPRMVSWAGLECAVQFECAARSLTPAGADTWKRVYCKQVIHELTA